jgi:hypothetical protein
VDGVERGLTDFLGRLDLVALTGDGMRRSAMVRKDAVVSSTAESWASPVVSSGISGPTVAFSRSETLSWVVGTGRKARDGRRARRLGRSIGARGRACAQTAT